MLKNMLKYDLKDVLKVLSIFYILSIFFALVTRLLSCFDSTIMTILWQISVGVTISMIFNILINNMMRMWARFRKNLYSEEAYLTHTLPITKATQILSKILAAVITIFISVAVMALTLFIAFYSKENMELIKALVLPIADAYSVSVPLTLIIFLFIFFLEVAVAIVVGFMGIIIGHRMQSAKIGFSVLYGFLVYMACQVTVLISVFLAGLINSDIMKLFTTNTVGSIDMLKAVAFLAIAVYSMLLAAVCIISNCLFKKGVNLD